MISGRWPVVSNPKGYQRVAGGRSEAKTTGSIEPISGTLKGCETPFQVQTTCRRITGGLRFAATTGYFLVTPSGYCTLPIAHLLFPPPKEFIDFSEWSCAGKTVERACIFDISRGAHEGAPGNISQCGPD